MCGLWFASFELSLHGMIQQGPSFWQPGLDSTEPTLSCAMTSSSS